MVKPPHGSNVAPFAERFPKLDRWRDLLRYICARITASTPLQRDRSLRSQEEHSVF
jgi:hypothetical protein